MSAAPLLIFYSLKQAKQKDENTIRLVGHFSSKYGYVKVRWLPAGFHMLTALSSLKSAARRKRNICLRYTVEARRQPSNVRLMRVILYPLKPLAVLVDYPPQVHALAWRLSKRCSSTTGKLSLRNPNFYPHPFIEGLSDDLIGRPLGFLGGQTYGLKPWAGEWTPRVEVYGDDPTGEYFKLESGGFSSVFQGIVELEKPKRVVFRGWYEFRPSELTY